MPTARSIIEGSLGFGLNRLSPGETLDADTADRCLTALNMIADELNGSGTFLFRDVMTAGTALSSASGTLGTTWATIPAGTKPLGATFNDGGDTELAELTFEQYQATDTKTLGGDPKYFAWDGYATVYFYPVPTSRVISLRTRQTVSNFADLDTDYGMPAGYKSALADLLSEKLAYQLLGNIPAKVLKDASNARSRLMAKNMRPAIIDARGARANILSGP